MNEEFYQEFMKLIPLFVMLDTEDPQHIREFHSMCMTYRHDYASPEIRLDEVAQTQCMFGGVFNHHVLPLLKKNEELVNGLCRCDKYFTFSEE